MPLLLLILAVLALVLGPGVWVRRIMKKYARPEDRYELTGGHVARQLLDSLGLQKVTIETTDRGDHYDPVAKAVRLSPENLDGRSLTAVTVAAHEVGHAMQDAHGYGPLHWRSRLVRWVMPIEKLGAGMMMAAPLMVLLTRTPVTGLLTIGGGVMTLAAGALVHAVTLPTEFDASFNRALPLLAENRILHEGDERHARKILKAAAMTYVAASLMSLLSIARWWAILRR